MSAGACGHDAALIGDFKQVAAVYLPVVLLRGRHKKAILGPNPAA